MLIRRIAFHSSLNLILQWCFAFFYIKSLKGGDLEWIKKELDLLGTHLLLSILCFSAALAHLFLLNASVRLLRLCLALSLALLLLTLQKYDNGDTPEEHGLYNFILFALIALPLNFCIGVGSLCFAYLPRQRFVFLISALVILSTLYISISLVYYSWTWKNGALGHRMQFEHAEGKKVSKLCTYSGTNGWNIPFVDLLPNGALNSWSGWQTCSSSQLKGIEAEWSEEDGILSIRCPNNLNPSYELLPDTRGFKTAEKLEGTFHKIVKKRTRQVEEYRGPVQIDDPDVGAIVAKCGPESDVGKLLLRVDSPKKSILERATAMQGRVLKHEPPNILLILLDAVSRRHFFRKMPQTVNVLESLAAKHDGHSLHQFFRYHAIGFSTDPNTRALYTNSSGKHSPPLDPIWKEFHGSHLGYRTGRVETNCEDWSTQYTGKASSEYLDYELIAPFCLPEYYPAEGNPFGNFQGPYSIRARCLSGQYVHYHALEYMKKLQRAYVNSSIPWFLIGTFIEGHEGSGEVLRTLDQDLANFFSVLDLDDQLENTLVLLLSDHGLHMGPNFLYTTNGKLEHVNPLLMMLLPPRVRSRYPSLLLGLTHTEQLLLTPYEVYNTLKLFSRGLPESGSEDETWKKGTLFDETLPSRGCAQARIPDNFCKCN